MTDREAGGMTDLDRLDALAGAATRAEGMQERADAYTALIRALDPADATIRELVAAVRERDELRVAAEAVVSKAETDDDFDGQYVDFLVPADAIGALRAALHREAGT